MYGARNRPNASRRCDGAETRNRIIECAGRLIAKQGYARTTSKSICEAAKVNMAAVNYHFGSREGLYLAVLTEAHRYLLSLEQLKALQLSTLAPKEKIEAFLDLYINNTLIGDDWRMELWAREEMSPSPLHAEILQQLAIPKLGVVVKIFAEYMELEETDPRIYNYITSSVAPFMLLFFGRYSCARSLLPDAYAELPKTAEELKYFVFAGLEALKIRLKNQDN